MNAQATSSQPRSPLRWAIALLLLLALAWGVKVLFFPPAPPPRVAPPVPVRTAPVQTQAMPITRNGLGKVLPAMSVTVRARIDGQLDSVEFKEGQDVRAGQLLAQIDPRTFQAQLDQNLAQKARDEAQLANARVDLTRYEELIKEEATTQQTLDTQRALVRQLEAAVQTDEAQIAQARVNLSYTRIHAPISGRIGARLVDPGNIVHASDPGGLLVINQIDPIAVQFTLPESDFQAVNRALNASATALTVQALDRDSREVLASGKLVLLNNQIDAGTGTISLKAQFANPEHKLWPGQSVDARLILGERAQALTVPTGAVQRGQSGLFVYVIEADDTARMQPITLADSDGGIAVVTEGLKDGERVVIDGYYRLTPGGRAVEMPAADAAAPAATQESAK
ncbi:MAG: efflux RND transporter periplasmic adaptor subunit [Betaproteobacteria bacterium]|nr:efflux RND transporter periplasmic adaptor subunit [Betaproteobacteria bacterium]MCL2886734.1 efflux RND transporter periplasmic adaptor subunit [Betaproteobacteria bacterium]